MKKALSVFLCLLLFASVFSVGVSAAEAGATVRSCGTSSSSSSLIWISFLSASSTRISRPTLWSSLMSTLKLSGRPGLGMFLPLTTAS